MKLLIKQRVFSWTDTYDIYDEYGNVRYFVKGDFSRLDTGSEFMMPLKMRSVWFRRNCCISSRPLKSMQEDSFMVLLQRN